MAELYLNSWCNITAWDGLLFFLSHRCLKTKNKETKFRRARSVIAWSEAAAKNCYSGQALYYATEWAHFNSAASPEATKLHSHSKHGSFIYWPWRVLFIQIEIKRQRGRKSFPWFNLPSGSKQITRGEYYLARDQDNECYSADGTASIFSAWWSCQRAPTPQTKKNISHLQTIVENVRRRAMSCCLVGFLISVKLL